MVLLLLHGAAAWCCCMALLHGATAYGAAAAAADATAAVTAVAVVFVYNYSYPRWTLDWGVTSWGSSTNIYVNTRVLSQCLLLPAHTIGNEYESTRISAHVLFWYAIVA